MKGVRKATVVVSEGTAFELKLNKLKYQRGKENTCKFGVGLNYISYTFHSSPCFVTSFFARVSHSVLLEVLLAKLIISQKKKPSSLFLINHRPNPEIR